MPIPRHTSTAIPLLLTLLLTLAACRSAPVPPPPMTPTPAPAPGSCGLDGYPFADDTAAVRAVLEAEGRLVVSQEINELMRLWSEQSQVADAKNTPGDGSDDQVWKGRDAIRNRYVRIVFPGAPAAVEHPDAEITIDGDQASVVAGTTIGSEVSPAGDRWELVRTDGCWAIASLTYNLEPQP